MPEGIVLTLVPRFTALHRRRRSHAGETRLSRTRTCCLMSMLSAMDRISLLWSEPHRCGPPDAPLDPSMSSLSVTPRIADDSSLWVSGRSGAGPACRVMPSDGWQFASSRPQSIPARRPLSGNSPGSLLPRPATAMGRCRALGRFVRRRHAFQRPGLQGFTAHEEVDQLLQPTAGRPVEPVSVVRIVARDRKGPGLSFCLLDCAE